MLVRPCERGFCNLWLSLAPGMSSAYCGEALKFAGAQRCAMGGGFTWPSWAKSFRSNQWPKCPNIRSRASSPTAGFRIDNEWQVYHLSDTVPLVTELLFTVELLGPDGPAGKTKDLFYFTREAMKLERDGRALEGQAGHLSEGPGRAAALPGRGGVDAQGASADHRSPGGGGRDSASAGGDGAEGGVSGEVGDGVEKHDLHEE
jgi:hypothetical protein